MDIVKINKGKVPRSLFDELIAENFGYSERTTESYAQIIRTFGMIYGR